MSSRVVLTSKIHRISRYSLYGTSVFSAAEVGAHVPVPAPGQNAPGVLGQRAPDPPQRGTPGLQGEFKPRELIQHPKIDANWDTKLHNLSRAPLLLLHLQAAELMLSRIVAYYTSDAALKLERLTPSLQRTVLAFLLFSMHAAGSTGLPAEDHVRDSRCGEIHEGVRGRKSDG